MHIITGAATQDVADTFADALGKAVKAEHISRDEGNITLKQTAFSPDGIKNFIEMTEHVCRKNRR